MNKSGLLSMLAGMLSILHFSEVNGGVIIAGTDTPSQSTALFTIHINDPYFSGGLTETISLSSGPFSILRQQQQGLGNGTPSSFIDTELRGLTLTGNSATFGPLTVRVGSDNSVQQGASLGQLQNVLTTTPGSPTLVGPEDFVSGDSFFDVFFEIDVAGLTFYNRVPHVLVAPGITSLPPVGSTHFPSGTVDLFFRVGSDNSPNDPLIGYAGGSHTITPEPASFAVLSLGFLAAVVISRRHQRRQLPVS